ncbi:MAG: ATP-binding protein [Nitrospinota bacterium]|nr:ATP-binding protein [Nitrospinota bacterium]
MTRVHLICGPTGSGKTTYSFELAKNIGAARFSIDEWMQNLYGPDIQDPIEYQWMIERVNRCETQILYLCKELIKLKIEIVLDLGFFALAQRKKFINALQEFGSMPQLHYLQVNVVTRWERVSARNKDKGDTYSLTVTRGQFDFCETIFETPSEEELRHAIKVPEKE